MSVFLLKIIAYVAMIIDHIGYCFIPAKGDTLILYEISRCIGRLAFPIFCFLLVEGFYHTKSIKKYLLRIFIFAVISEPAFDFCFNFLTISRWYLKQNVFFTLFIGLLVVTIVDYLRKEYAYKPAIYNTAASITIILGSLLAYLLKTDYSYMGVIFILIFYFFRERKIYACLAFAVVVLCFYVDMSSTMYINLHCLLALLPIWLYNGKKGPSAKYLFYTIYPLHLAVFGLLRVTGII